MAKENWATQKCTIRGVIGPCQVLVLGNPYLRVVDDAVTWGRVCGRQAV